MLYLVVVLSVCHVFIMYMKLYVMSDVYDKASIGYTINVSRHQSKTIYGLRIQIMVKIKNNLWFKKIIWKNKITEVDACPIYIIISQVIQHDACLVYNWIKYIGVLTVNLRACRIPRYYRLIKLKTNDIRVKFADTWF